MKFEPEVEMVLEFARTAREPPSAVRLQNLATVRSRLGVPGATAPTGDAAGTAAASRPAKLSANLRQLIATGVMAGTVGVLIGLGLGLRASEAAPEGRGLEGQSLEEPRAVTSAVQATATEGGVKAPPRAGSKRADLTQQASKGRMQVGQSSAKPGDTRPTKPIDRSFFVALRLLERARHALDVGEPLLAQSLLDELDDRFPPDLLEEERLATRALGWCALGEHGRAESAARKLLADNPRSIYAERLEQSCVRTRAMVSK